MATQLEELDASIRELEASLAGASPDMQPMMRQQLANMQSARDMLARAGPEMRNVKAQRAALSPELARYFTPEPPASVPAWVPDAIVMSAVTDEWLRCPPGARVYRTDTTIGCAVPSGPGRVPIRNGLELGFFTATGRLEWQRFYEHGLLRWAIEYHASGARAQVGFYSATEPLTYPAHGLQTRFAPNQTVVAQGQFEHGVQVGWHKFWEDDGFPIGATRYEQGRACETVLPDGTRR